MKLKVVRETKNDVCTIGSLFINDVFFCYTLEDKDRGLKQSDSLLFIQAKKIFGLTAIPSGFYKLTVNQSPKFKRMLPRILDIKGFDGVLLHRGNNANHSLGCILVGYKKADNSIFESTKAETDLVNRLLLHYQEVHTIEIV
jgi:hypothetical protein